MFQSFSALHRASNSGSYDLAVGLIKNGADVNAKTDDGWIPLHSGTVFSFIIIILFNFTNKILIRETIKACRWNQASVASLLLACGSDVNAKTNGGLTAIQ